MKMTDTPEAHKDLRAAIAMVMCVASRIKHRKCRKRKQFEEAWSMAYRVWYSLEEHRIP